MAEETGIVDKDYSIKVINPKNSSYPFQRKVKLGADLKKEIEEDLYRLYIQWESGTSQLRSKIQRWVNNSEGISRPKDFPWKNSSNIFKPITETRMNIVHSFFMGVLRPRVGRIFRCVTDKKYDKERVKLCRKIEHFFNNNRDFNLMYVENVDEAFWSVLQCGTIGRTADWLRKVERRWEVVKYKTLDEFVAKFPTPESGNFSEEDYFDLVQRLSLGELIQLDEDYDDVAYDGPVIDYRELKDCVWFPVNSRNQEGLIFNGYRFYMRKSEIMSKAKKDKVFDDVDDIFKQEPIEDMDSVTQLQDQIEGLSETDVKTQYGLLHGRYMLDLDDDGVEEKYLVTYAFESKKLIQFDKYPFYHNQDFQRFTGFKKRPKRLLWRGVPEMLEDLNEEANIAARQRIDSRAITNSPHFKVPDVLKVALDPNRPENKIRPGGIWWLPLNLIDKVTQLDVAKKDFGDSMNEEASIDRSADNIIGASELRSGRETPLDPRAPAAKTAMLLNQSSSRLDDFVYGFILNENKILDMVLQLYYQFGPDLLKVYVENLEGQAALPGQPPQQEEFVEENIEREAFNYKDIHLQLSFTSIMENPEFLKAAWEEFYVKYGQEPLLGAIPEIRHIILDEIITNFPEATGKKLLLPLDVIMQKMPMMPPGGAPGTMAPGSVPPVNPTLQKAISSPMPGGV